MTRVSHQFDGEVIDTLAQLLSEHEDPMRVADLVAVSGMPEDTVGVLLPRLGERTPFFGSEKYYRLHPDWQDRTRAVRIVVDQGLEIEGQLDGVCPGCTCRPTADDFAMRDGKPYLPACPRRRRQPDSQAVSQWIRKQLRATLEARVLGVLRLADGPLSESELAAAVGVKPAPQFTTLLAQLVGVGLAVRVLVTRAGMASIAKYSAPETLPESLGGRR